MVEDPLQAELRAAELQMQSKVAGKRMPGFVELRAHKRVH